MKKAAPPPPAAKLSNGDVLRRLESEPPARPPMSCTPGEDCAFDELLEGRMDLEVVLPDKRLVHITVDRRTPMMDLLVHVTTSNKLTAGNHTIKLLTEEQHNILYKPNTPIGSLDINTVYIVPKSSVEVPVKRMPKLPNQPFEQTFRLQVNLPRNQRMVKRVSPHITLAELKRQICNEKELDHSNHHLVHPAQPDTVLDLNSTLDVYGCAEISLLSNSGLRDSINSLTTQLIAYPRTLDEEKKKKGILRLFSKKKKETPVENSSNGINNQGISTVRSETLTRDGYQPKQSTKRKPAPAPPLPMQSSSPPLVIQSSSSINSRPESEISAKTDELGSTVSHSRHSSDSSGYHEPSVFSDCSENKSPEASIVHGGNVLSGHETTFCKDFPDCLSLVKPSKDPSNLKTVPSCSNTSIVSAARKRKAPQPPAPALPEVETPSPEDQPTFEFITEEPTALEGGELERDPRARESTAVEETDLPAQGDMQQESEALEYFENVLQESEAVNNMESSKFNCDFSEEVEPEVEENAGLSQLEGKGSATPIPSECDMVDHSVVASVPMLDSVASSASDVVSDSEISKPCEVTTTLSNVPECEKTSTDSDYYADLSSTSTDASEVMSVPLNKDILSKDDSSGMPISESSYVECVAAEIHNEPLDCIIETPSVPSEDTCPSPETVSDCAGNYKSKDKDLDYMDHCVLSTESPKFNKSKTGVTGSETSTPPSEVVTPSSQRRLVNFAMGCYKSEMRDIYEEAQPVDKKDERVLRHEFQGEVQVHAEPTLSRRAVNVKITPFEDRKAYDTNDISLDDNIKGQVKQKCTQLSNISTLPLTGRSSSLYNLSPNTKPTQFKPLGVATKIETAALFLKRTHSDQNVSQEVPVEEKSEFVDEQKRLHDEYLKLQVQFINWQKQLLNNQALLQTEQIVPEMFPALEQYKIELEKLPAALQTDVYSEQAEEEDFKTRSLPRPKSRTLSVKQQSRDEAPPVISRHCKSEEVIEASTALKHEKAVMSDSGISTEETSDHSNIPSETNEDAVEPGSSSKCQTLPRLVNRPTSALETSKTMTLNRQVRPKAQVVSVTIGSWQQRNMAAPDINSAAVASSRSMFQSLENLPRENRATPPVPVQRKKAKAASAAKSEDNIDSSKPPAETAVKAVPREEIKRITETAKAPEVIKETQKVEKALFKKPELVKQRPKADPKSPTVESSAPKKAAKPFIRLSSMKDDPQPPPALHVLKKWPLPDVSENKDVKKPAEQSFWEEIAASARRPTGRSREKVTHAEVDLRRNRSAKSDPSSNTTRNKYLEESKVHVTKVNIGNSDSTRPKDSGAKSKPQRSSSATPLSVSSPPCHSEPFNTELKNVLSKRASALAEPTYAEARNGHGENGEASFAVQSSSPPPPPPPPVSTMPAIPPAAPIPKSSQLLMEKRTANSTSVKKQPQPKSAPSMAPREELMLEIRGFGGRQALRKVPTTQPGWHLKVYGSASAVNS